MWPSPVSTVGWHLQAHGLQRADRKALEGLSTSCFGARAAGLHRCGGYLSIRAHKHTHGDSSCK